MTIRSIATEAGVDAALISYHFGSKAGLFGAAMRLPTNPAQVLTAAIGGPLNTLPERLVRAVLDVWDDPNRGGPLRAFATAAVLDAEVGRLFRQMAEREIIGRLAERISGADATQRAAVAASQISGVIFLRYILQFEPLASMPADELTARMVPALRAALVGPRHWAPNSVDNQLSTSQPGVFEQRGR